MIGLLPAAGSATRIHGLPKMLLPVGETYLLQKHVDEMRGAGARQVYIGAREDNADLLRQYAGKGQVYVAQRYATMTETVQSIPKYALRDEPVLFGMPDSYWPAQGVYGRLTETLEAGADVAVAVFKARPKQHKRAGMCRVHRQTFEVLEVVDKPEQTELMFLWGALAWQPIFWQYMKPSDPHVGYALPRAIAAGLRIIATNGKSGYYDCGTVDGYYEALTAAREVQEWQRTQA